MLDEISNLFIKFWIPSVKSKNENELKITLIPQKHKVIPTLIKPKAKLISLNVKC